MIKSDAWSSKITKKRGWRASITFSHFSLAMALFALLLIGGVVIALLLGGIIGKLGIYIFGAITGIILMAIIILLRQNELAATIVIAVHLYVDWYLGLAYIGLVITLGLLVIWFLARSPQHPWIEPGAIWLWALFLALGIFPALQGATDPYDIALYYPNIIFGSLIIFWLGIVIARDRVHVKRIFQLLAGFGTLIAVHTIIQATTGVSLFGSPSREAFLASVSNYQLGGTGSDVHRIGSFFVDPNWNGTFLGMMLFLSLGLLVESPSLIGKVLYLAEMFLMLPALLFTYSNGAWVGAGAGVVTFIIFAGHIRYRILLPLLILGSAATIIIFFPSQLAVQLQHASNPNELALRVAVWQTAIRVIAAFPLTGVGLTHYTYAQQVEPFRVAAQYAIEDHPHNSYLELGAMAGLPVLLIFITLLSLALRLAFRNWMIADVHTRSLLGGGIAAVIALAINSISINAWTLPPLAAAGWLILGIISSPLLSNQLNRQKVEEKNLQ